MSKETNSQLSDEFKKDIHENGGKKNVLGTILAFIAVLLVFGTIGVAGYELILKPEEIKQKSADEKIESRPEAVEETKEVPKVEAVVTTPATPAETQAEYTDYTVVEGDSYSSIANANSMSSADLMKYNGVTTEDLQIGQVIKIPKK